MIPEHSGSLSIAVQRVNSADSSLSVQGFGDKMLETLAGEKSIEVELDSSMLLICQQCIGRDDFEIAGTTGMKLVIRNTESQEQYTTYVARYSLHHNLFTHSLKT